MILRWARCALKFLRASNIELPLSSHPLCLFWAEDQVWDLHQPPAGQNPRRDGWPGEDRSQRTGRSHHGGPRMPPPQDAVIPFHQPGSQWGQREDRCTEELRGHRRTRDHNPSLFPSPVFCVILACLRTSVPSWFLMIIFRNDQTRWCASLLLRQYMRWKPASNPEKTAPCKISWTFMIAHLNDHSYDHYLWHLSVLC